MGNLAITQAFKQKGDITLACRHIWLPLILLNIEELGI